MRLPGSTLPSAPGAPTPLGREVVEVGRRQGLAAVGLAGTTAFDDTRADLLDRRARGLHGGMAFTYRNPERSTDPGRLLRGARTLVVGAWWYERRADPPPAGSRPRGEVAAHARRDHYASLRAALRPVADRLTSDGWRALVVCDDNGLVDRAAAHRAGLGWFGKNTLLLLPGLGSWFVLGSVVTDAPLLEAAGEGSEPDPRPLAHGSGCGSCTRCQTACPTGALTAAGELDARRCLAWLLQAEGSFPEELRPALGARLYGCDECQRVCPVNRRADRRTPPPGAEADTVASVDLITLLDASDEELLRAHGRWYIPRRQPRYLRRNALVALGNIGDGADPDTARVLARAIGGPDPMVAEHAAWAARRLGRADLVGRHHPEGRTA